MIDFVTGIIKSMNLSPGRTQALLGAVLAVGGGVWVYGQVFNGGDAAAPHVNIINNLQLPPGMVLSTTPAIEPPRTRPDVPFLPPAGPDKAAAAAASPAPAAPSVPLDRVRTVAKGQSFALCGQGAFDFSPFLPMPGRPRQAMLRNPTPIPGAAPGVMFERLLTVGVASELWPGCEVQLTAVDESPSVSLTFREQFSARSK